MKLLHFVPPIAFLVVSAPRGCLAVQNDADIMKPSKRYRAHDSISGSVKTSADNIGYSSSSWNSFTESIEASDYETIETTMASKLNDVNNLLDGSSKVQWEPSWDCWLNHYENFDWAELVTEGVDQYMSTLGWTQSSWDANQNVPAESKDWNDLTSSERTAASEICYIQLTWDGESLGSSGTNPPGGDNGFSFCLSGVNKVQVRGKGLVQVESVQIGDYVLAGNDQFSRVYSFLHLDHELETDYLQIHVNDNGEEPLEISRGHLLLVGNKMRRASEVAEGDSILYNGEARLVQKIETVQRKGAYAPVTETGDIVVGGVLCSSYVGILDHASIDQHFATHAIMSPARCLCSLLSFGICEHEIYIDGYSMWIFAMMKVVEYVNSFPALLQAVVSCLAFPFFLVMYLAVEVMMSPMALGVIAVGAVGLFLCARGRQPTA